ncbi:hypothetical protein LGN07_15365 [Burkholderia cepacia]|uniref:hypothetical protein n=1 Tax=Burkholderia cepacia TaxID=292 RepID=UPI0012D94CF5|nr:hypothetical protein [Burkholderia cepacia]MCA8120097.1 hypothetical protein [Burkholderia cepacia]
MNSDIEIGVAAASAISTALQDAQGKIKVEDYKIILSEREDGFYVSFVAIDTPVGQRGAAPGKPGINYILDKQGVKILREYRTR